MYCWGPGPGGGCSYKDHELQAEVIKLKRRVKDLEDILIPLTKELKERIEKLTEGVEVDLNEPLPEEE